MLSFSKDFSKKITAITLVLLLLSAFLIFFLGIKKGLDFQGGVVTEFVLNNSKFSIPNKENVVELRYILQNELLESFNLQIVGGERWVLSVASAKVASDKQSEDIANKLHHLLGKSMTIVKSEYVGPQVTKILYKQAITGLSLALLAMLIYVTFRFNFTFGYVATICLLHDILLSILFISVSKIETNLTIVAALLTIIGYSINNTIVIYDRIRNVVKSNSTNENLISYSVKKVLKRTLITSLLTIFSLLGLIFFSDVSIKNFALTVIFGIVVGGYSSTILAPSLLILFRASLNFVDHDTKYATIKKPHHYSS